jgi:flagellar motor switch protein FliN/FliY
MADESKGPASGKPEPAAGGLARDEVEALLAQAGQKTMPAKEGQPSVTAAPPPPRERQPDPSLAPGDMELLLKQAEEALASIREPNSPAVPGLKPFQLEHLTGAPPNTEQATFDLIRDVELDLRIEFGRTNMLLEDVLKLRKGSVVALDKLAGDPVDVFVNGRLIARGEVLVLNDSFCVRVAELITGQTVGEPA